MSAYARSSYREFKPPPALADRVVCLWVQQVDHAEADYEHLVLPDGCVDIVWIDDAPPTVAGPATQPVVVHLRKGALLVGARFRPGWAAGSLGIPADQLVDRSVPLEDMASHNTDDLFGRVVRWQSGADRLREVSQMLSRHFGRLPGIDPAVDHSIRWLVDHPGGRVRDLSDATGLSERQTLRRFMVGVGYGPKTFQRVLRLQRLLVLTQMRDPSPALADLVHICGYSDQSHLSREVRGLTGVTPHQLFAGSGYALSMSEFFKTPGDAGG